MSDPLYQALIDFSPRHGPPDFAYAIIKQTFQLQRGKLREVEAAPLFLDLRENKTALLPGSDYRLTKTLVDVAIMGDAFPERNGDRERILQATIGTRSLRLYVCGDRTLKVAANGRAVFSKPDPFDQIALTFENAYGGLDGRVPVQDPPVPAELALEADHPGMYPRNPYGKGYVVLSGAVAGVLLPNVEREDMRLTPGGVITGDPRHWYRQPIPAQWGWSYPHTFPRHVWWNLEPWYPPPDDNDLPEVQRGWLPMHYRSVIPQNPKEAMAHASAVRFMQEASPELTFSDLLPGTPFHIEGMLPGKGGFSFLLPPRPKVEVLVGGRVRPVTPQLTHLVVRPNDEAMDLTYHVRAAGIPKRYIPGLSRHIPLGVRVNDDAPIAYATPAPIQEKLKAHAMAAAPNPNR